MVHTRKRLTCSVSNGLFGLMVFLIFSGCATIFSDGEDTITFHSNVDKTKVFLNNSLVGETPLTLDVDRTLHSPKVRFSKEGYKTQEMPLVHEFNSSPAMILDLTGTLTSLTPGAIDALTGNLIRYSPTEYHIEMEPEKTGNLDLFQKRVASMRFASYNFSDIRRDLLSGERGFLNALRDSFGISPNHRETFEKVLRNNLETLAGSQNGLEFWYRLNQKVKEHPQLAGYYLG